MPPQLALIWVFDLAFSLCLGLWLLLNPSCAYLSIWSNPEVLPGIHPGKLRSPSCLPVRHLYPP